MGRYGRRLGATITIMAAMAVYGCTESDSPGPAATSVPPVQQVAGDLSYQDLLPESRQGIAPSLQDDAVTRLPTTPTARPTVSEALAQRIAEQHFAVGSLRIQYPEIEPAGAVLVSRRLMLALSTARNPSIGANLPGDEASRYWLVNFQAASSINLSAGFVGAVIDAETGDVVRVFLGENAPITPPRIP